MQWSGLRTFKTEKKASAVGLGWEGTERNVSYSKDDKKYGRKDWQTLISLW